MCSWLGVGAAAEKEWPRGETELEAAAAITRERHDAELRAAAGQHVRVYASEGTGWTVVLEEGSVWRSAPQHRFLRVHPVRNRSDLFDALQPVAPHLAAVGMAGFGSESAALAQALGRLGASRICAPGEMQSPPLAWHRDGRPLLVPLARFSDISISD